MFFPNHCFPLIKALIKKPLVLHVFWVPQTLRCFVRFPPVISSPGHKRSSKVVAFWISSLRAVASKVFTSLTPRTWQADAERNNGRFNKRGWCLSVMNIYIYIYILYRERERDVFEKIMVKMVVIMVKYIYIWIQNWYDKVIQAKIHHTNLWETPRVGWFVW